MKPSILGCAFSTTLWSAIASQANSYTEYETPRPLAINLLFPKNETYKPQFRFPIVFALDPTVFWPFDFQLYYTLDISILSFDPKRFSYTGGFPEGTHNQTDSAIPSTVENPMLIVNTTDYLNDLVEAQVLMRYWVGFPKTCNGTTPSNDTNDDGTGSGPPFFSGSMGFSVSNSSVGQIPDLSSSGNCSQTVGLFNVLGEYEAESCPVVQTRQIEGECGFRVTDTLERRVADHILNEACGSSDQSDAMDWQRNPSVKWPNPTATTLSEFCDSGAVKTSVRFGYIITLSTILWVVL